MSKKIHKFVVPVTGLSTAFTTAVKMPASARILYVREQNLNIAMWCEVSDPDSVSVYRKFQIFVTDEEVPPHVSYVGSGLFDQGQTVVHLYEARGEQQVITSSIISAERILESTVVTAETMSEGKIEVESIQKHGL